MRRTGADDEIQDGLSVDYICRMILNDLTSITKMRLPWRSNMYPDIKQKHHVE